MSPKAVETENLTKRYGDVTALNDLTFDVDEGELFGLLGPNGAGKSTTIEILTGQTEPTSGSARVLGTDPSNEPVEARSKLGILPEREDPPSFLTPREYFEFVGDLRGIESLEERVDDWAERLGFEGELDTVSMDLSRGQKQKVMFTQAFLHEPELVLIDEPLTNLDPIIQERVKEFVVEYNERGKTVLLSTHDITVAEEVCSRVGIIDGGKLVAERDIDEVTEASSLIDEFLNEVGEGAVEEIKR
ncbi:MAG: ABC transporter ATP-binding protein, partial [Halobacteria archaeon]|nr:ABC transporter ATP-binding protein [Halobacteria archaeon]